MDSALTYASQGVLDETTNTVHRHETGAAEYETECGGTTHVAGDSRRRLPVERAMAGESTSKCGRCVTEAGGY